MNHKLKGFTLIELIVVCLLIGFIALGCGMVIDSMAKSDKIDDNSYEYKIYITIADHEYYYYTDTVKVINNGNAIKFTDKTTEKTYVASQYFIEFN